MVRVQLPPQFVEDARAFADGSREPAEPRNAATVVLLRPGPDGPEVYLLRRQTSMAFAGGHVRLPRRRCRPARLRPRDSRGPGPSPPSGPHSSAPTRPPPGRSCARPCARPSRSRACCWPGESAETVVADTTGEDWESDRAALEARELAFTDFLDRRGLVLRTDLLGRLGRLADSGLRAAPLPHLVLRRRPPRGPAHPRRLHGVRPGHLAASHAGRRAMSRQEQLLMLPPTYLTCLEVGQYADPAAVLDAARDRSVEMYMPEVEETEDGGTLSVPPRLRGTPGDPVESGVVSRSELVWWILRRARGMRAGAERQHDDPRRHQHLDPARAGRRTLDRGRPRPAGRSHTSTPWPSRPATWPSYS